MSILDRFRKPKPAPIPDVLLSEHDLVKRWQGHIALQTLRNWRWKGRGPRFIKMGGKPLYPEKEIIAWERNGLKKFGREKKK